MTGVGWVGLLLSISAASPEIGDAPPSVPCAMMVHETTRPLFYIPRASRKPIAWGLLCNCGLHGDYKNIAISVKSLCNR